MEVGPLDDLRPVAHPVDTPGEPRIARQTHLGAETQASWDLKLLHAPEVKCFTYDERGAASPAKAWTADDLVEQPLNDQSHPPPYQPFAPPMRSIAAKTASGVADVVAERLSLRTVVPDHSGSVSRGANASRGVARQRRALTRRRQRSRHGLADVHRGDRNAAQAD